MADGGNVELAEIDGLVVKLKLNGACGSCPSRHALFRSQDPPPTAGTDDTLSLLVAPEFFP